MYKQYWEHHKRNIWCHLCFSLFHDRFVFQLIYTSSCVNQYRLARAKGPKFDPIDTILDKSGLFKNKICIFYPNTSDSPDKWDHLNLKDVKVGIKNGSDWAQMEHIWDILRSVSPSQNVLKLILKSPRFVPFGGQSNPIRMPNLTPLESTHSHRHNIHTATILLPVYSLLGKIDYTQHRGLCFGPK